MRPVAAPTLAGGLPRGHALLALAVVAVWGSNFVVIREALRVWPPLWLAALRFALALLPLLVLVAPAPASWRRLLARPAVGWRNLLAYGALIGAGQFALLFLAMKGHIAPGLASLVIQTQVFFTIGLAMLVEGERPRLVQGLALLLALAGLALIGMNVGGDATVKGLLMILGAAAAWAMGNIVGRRARGVSALAYVSWSSFGAVPPLVLAAWMFEGPAALVTAWHEADVAAWAALTWQALGNTLFGYGAWGWLMQRYPAATVSPWALGVPVFGMASAAWWLGEALPAWKLGAAALVVGGLALNALAGRR